MVDDSRASEEERRAAMFRLTRSRVLRAPSASAMEKVVVVPKSADHGNTLVYLHGYDMEAKDRLDLFLRLSKGLPRWRFVLPQAEKMRITSSGVECRSWFDYLAEREGQAEDTVDVFGMRTRREQLRQLVYSEVATLGGRSDRVFLGGMSQGGVMALDAALHMSVGGVVTLVAPRLSTHLSRPLACPWHALMAKGDEIFPLAWSENLLTGAASVEFVEGNHWLDGEVEHAFLCSTLKKFEDMVKTGDAGVRV